jgi:hypothetical protein
MNKSKALVQVVCVLADVQENLNPVVAADIISYANMQSFIMSYL